MPRDNRLRAGTGHFSFSTLPPESRKHGCSLHRATFEPTIGPEVFAFFREDPGYAENLEGVHPFVLIVHPGVARTPFGSVAFIVWQIAAGEPQEVLVEQYLNPAQDGALALVSDASEQTHFKFVAINRETGNVSVVVDFENEFGFKELYDAMLAAKKDDPCNDFQGATEFLTDKYTVKELILLSRLDYRG
jgi:hypothetical protein